MKTERSVDIGCSVPRLFMTVRQLAKFEQRSELTIRNVIGEIKEQIMEGRYPKTAVGEYPLSVNYYVYRDYVTYRKRLKEKNLKSQVPKFNAREIAAICPIIRESIKL